MQPLHRTAVQSALPGAAFAPGVFFSEGQTSDSPGAAQYLHRRTCCWRGRAGLRRQPRPSPGSVKFLF